MESATEGLMGKQVRQKKAESFSEYKFVNKVTQIICQCPSVKF